MALLNEGSTGFFCGTLTSGLVLVALVERAGLGADQRSHNFLTVDRWSADLMSDVKDSKAVLPLSNLVGRRLAGMELRSGNAM